MMSEHARLSPSNQRWPHCPGSIREEAHYPDTPGRAAIDGTGTHMLLEKCLEHGHIPYDYIEHTIGIEHSDMPLGWIIDRERADRVQMALDYVERRRRELTEVYPGTKIVVEPESRSYPGYAFMPRREDWHGTCDITIRALEKMNSGWWARFIEVADYKDGRGWVPAEENTQLQSYVAGKVPHSATGGAYVEGVRTTIIQPRTSPVIRSCDYTWTRIHEVAWDLYQRAARTDDDDASLHAGWWCQWCKANPKRGGHCTQPAQQATQEVQMTTDTSTGLEGLLDLDVTTASGDQLATIMDQKPLIDDAFQRVEQEIQSRLDQELDVPGWAMKPGRKKREWADEQAVIDVLKTTSLKIDEYAPRKLLTPAQAEKVVSKRTLESKLKDLIEEWEGKTKPQRVSQAKPKDTEAMFNTTPGFL